MLERTGRTVLLVFTAAVALMAPAAASADLLSPGDVGTEATTRMDAETFARDPGLKRSDFVRDEDSGAATSESSYRWPRPSGGAPTAFTCAVTGCTGYDGRAYGSADLAAGKLKAVATGSLYIGNPPQDGYGLAGYIFSDGAAAIADTITLSAPATVILRGSLDGRMGGSNSHYEEQGNDPDAWLEASLAFTSDRLVCDIEWCERERLGGWEEELEASILHCGGLCAAPGDLIDDLLYDDVHRTFEVQVSLPAGTTNFNAELAAGVDYQVYGERDELVRKWADMVFGNSLDFEIEVPGDVVATSGSGLLPIVGGAQDTDTTAPVVLGPPDLSVANDAAQCAAAVQPGIATASDDRPGVTVGGVRGDGLALDAPYPVGTTTIVWTATDAAGNTAVAAQTVTVVDAEEPSVTPPAAVTVGNDPGRGDAAVDPGAATAADNCSGVVVAGTRSDGAALDAPYPVGTSTITWTATDLAGNAATAGQQVTVEDVEAPTITVPSSLTVDATSPAGAVVTYPSSAADNVGVESFACAPASGTAFSIGTTTVTCTVADAAGNSETAMFVVTVRGAADQLADLVDLLTEQSLRAKAQAAQAAAARGNTAAACNILGALLNQVDALEGKKLTAAQAEEIRSRVASTRGVLGCG